MINLFVRQPLTQSGNEEQKITQEILNTIDKMNGKDFYFNYLTGKRAENVDTFKRSFENDSGTIFSPKNFRDYRLALLSQATAFLYIRVNFSESGAFEVAYNIFKGNRAPMFFAVWKNAPIKTTLLRDLDDVCEVTYVEFGEAHELTPKLYTFFKKINDGEGARPSA